jgi:hypothetical protein
MTMFENLSPTNPVYRLLEPQSSYVIPFDDLLLLGWDALPGIPPTSLATAPQLLELVDLYADGREFFDDDPTTTLERFGLSEADFSVDEPWDQFPIARDLLEIWDATGRYVDTYVEHHYPTDEDVASDHEVQRWIVASGPDGYGNVRGLPAMDSEDALKRVLHSIVYRIISHGSSRLYGSANPALTFVANFPPVMHDATIPQPDAAFDNATCSATCPTPAASARWSTSTSRSGLRRPTCRSCRSPAKRLTTTIRSRWRRASPAWSGSKPRGSGPRKTERRPGPPPAGPVLQPLRRRQRRRDHSGGRGAALGRVPARDRWGADRLRRGPGLLQGREPSRTPTIRTGGLVP